MGSNQRLASSALSSRLLRPTWSTARSRWAYIRVSWNTSEASKALSTYREDGREQNHSRRLIGGQEGNMASDEDYMAFLNAASSGIKGGKAKAATGQEARCKTMDEGVEVPKVLGKVCKEAVYESDADEPFVKVGLRYQGSDGLPDEVEFVKLAEYPKELETQVTIMDPVDWDPQGLYSQVIEAVREACQGNDVRVYQVVRDPVRTDYWLIARLEEMLVGVKTMGVES